MDLGQLIAGDLLSSGGAGGGESLLGPPLAGSEALAEAVGRASELEQVAAVGEPVEERRCQPLVAREDGRPVGELEIARDDERTPGVPMREQGEQQLALVGIEADEAQLVADQQVEPIERRLQAAQAMLGLRLGELGHEPGHGHEAGPSLSPTADGGGRWPWDSWRSRGLDSGVRVWSPKKPDHGDCVRHDGANPLAPTKPSSSKAHDRR